MGAADGFGRHRIPSARNRRRGTRPRRPLTQVASICFLLTLHPMLRLRGRTRTARTFVTGAAVTLAAWAGLTAATPTFWTVSTQSDFLKGDVEDLSIDSDGRIFLGPSASLLTETAAPFLWTVIAGSDGTLWAGSGNEGQVLKIAKDGKSSTFFDAA